ncbi:MAG: carboxypeptidase M32, partial [Paracoccaceae bacterium]
MGYAQLLDVTGRINDFLNAANILNWDSRTMMPRAGGETRGQQVATLSVAARDLLCSDETRRALEAAEAETHNLPKGDVKRVIAQHVREAIEYHERIPTSVLRRKEELAGVAHDLWADARAQSDFSVFAPALEKMVEVNREMAAAIGIGTHPYESLLHKLEPGTRIPDLDVLFKRLRDGMLPLVRAIGEKEQPRADFMYRHYPAKDQ